MMRLVPHPSVIPPKTPRPRPVKKPVLPAEYGFSIVGRDNQIVASYTNPLVALPAMRALKGKFELWRHDGVLISWTTGGETAGRARRAIVQREEE